MAATCVGGADTGVLVGKLVRKKKREDRWVLAVRPEPYCVSNENDVDEWVQPTSQDVYLPRSNKSPLPYDFLFLFCVIKVTYDCSVQEDGETEEDLPTTKLARNIELLQCAPNPTSISLILQGISEGRFPWSVIPALNKQNLTTESPNLSTDGEAGGESDMDVDALALQHVEEILAMKNPSRPRRLAIARLVRGLENGPSAAVDRAPRSRKPFIRPKEHLLLQDLERFRDGNSIESPYKWSWMEPQQLTVSTTRVDKDIGGEMEGGVPLNLPTASEDEISYGNKHTRAEYMLEKKFPQVESMVHRIRQLFDEGEGPVHIVDVGGGRCDLATALAMEFSACVVTVVDKNESSLRAGQDYARRMGCSSRMNFVCGDMGRIAAVLQHEQAEFLGSLELAGALTLAENENDSHNTGLPPVDLVVALHACGDLSDVALTLANQLCVPFVICPCCYTKQYISEFQPTWNQYFCPEVRDPVTKNLTEAEMQELYRTSLCRLAEMDDDLSASRLARTAINSMRLYGMQQSGGYHVAMEEYERNSSRRNMVLVGSR